MDWEYLHRIADVIAILTLPAAITGISILELGRRMPRIRKFFGWGLVVLAAAFYAYDIADRFNAFATPSPIDIITSYGANGVYAEIVANTKKISDFKGKSKLIMMIYCPGPEADMTTDKDIVKSKEYEITGEEVTLSAKISDNLTHNRPPGVYSLTFYAAMIPNRFSPDVIMSIGDIEKFGGTVVGRAQMGNSIVLTPGSVPRFQITPIPNMQPSKTPP
jgi:hypothetical protein